MRRISLRAAQNPGCEVLERSAVKAARSVLRRGRGSNPTPPFDGGSLLNEPKHRVSVTYHGVRSSECSNTNASDMGRRSRRSESLIRTQNSAVTVGTSIETWNSRIGSGHVPTAAPAMIEMSTRQSISRNSPCKIRILLG